MKAELPTLGSLFFAPIAGYSDIAMRTMAYRYGASLCFTEMVSAKGIVFGNEGTASLLKTADAERGKTAAQIFGSDEASMAQAVNFDCLKDFPIIDINMGCPVPKIVKNGEGSALMQKPKQAHAIVKAVKKAAGERLVTVKMRTGFTKDNQNAVEVALACQEAGASLVTVHGRTREQFYSGEADLNIIRKVKDALNIPVCGNGDVKSREGYLKMREVTGVDYVMVARGAIGRPYVFSEILNLPFKFDIKEAMLEHMETLSHLPERAAVNAMKRFAVFYVKGLKFRRAFLDEIFKAGTVEEIRDIIIKGALI